jgi:hypothetical protein
MEDQFNGKLAALMRRAIPNIVGVGRHKPTGKTVHLLDERNLWGQPEFQIKFIKPQGSGMTTWWDARQIEVVQPIIGRPNVK